MPRPRRNPNALGPQQDPRNIGQNRAASMRGNNRRQNAFSPGSVQGGLGQGPGMAPGMNVSPQQGQCPAGQISKPGPDGRPTCVPAAGAGQPGMAPQTGVAPQRSGAGIPAPNGNSPYKKGY